MDEVTRIDTESTETQVTDAHRRLYYLQELTSYRQLNKAVPGGLIGALIGMAAGIGRIDGNPPDLSSISEMLGVPRATLWRRARKMEEAGFVELRRQGRRVLVLSRLGTGEINDRFQDVIDALIREARQNLKL